MVIRFTCPAGHRLKAPDEKSGRGMLCPACQDWVTVPEATVADAGAARPVPPPVEAVGTLSGEEAGSSEEVVASPMPPPATQADVGNPQAAAAARAASRVSTPWSLAAGLFVVLVYSALPAIGHVQADPVPGWARAALATALLQAVFVVWMLTVRHWLAIAIVAVFFAVAAVGYAALAVSLFAGTNAAALPWGHGPVPSRAAVWAATVLAVYLLATYFCGAAALQARREESAGTGG